MIVNKIISFTILFVYIQSISGIVLLLPIIVRLDDIVFKKSFFDKNKKGYLFRFEKKALVIVDVRIAIYVRPINVKTAELVRQLVMAILRARVLLAIRASCAR